MRAIDGTLHGGRAAALRLALAAALLFLGRSAGWAEQAGDFSAFAGSFRGGGEVLVNDGRRERIVCRATGSIGGGGRTLSQNIVCASDTYRFDIRGQVVASGADVSGDWQETTRGVSGAVTGRIANDRFSGAINGAGFSAGFNLRVMGRKMSFNLRPSDSSIVRVDVSLSR